ncbi:MAG: hypothetical protein MRZ54_05450 [Clostridiales bacterium]|nr:hypothetical protein [Clostridiales bacterium]
MQNKSPDEIHLSSELEFISFRDAFKQLIKKLSKQTTPWEIDGDSLLGQQTPHESLPCLLFHRIALPLEGNLRHMRHKKFLVQCFFA